MHNISVTWRSNKKAWMTLKLFDECIISLDKLMLKENRRILMFLDNSTSYSTTIQKKLTNVN